MMIDDMVTPNGFPSKANLELIGVSNITDTNYTPFSFIAKDTNDTGVDIDTIQEMKQLIILNIFKFDSVTFDQGTGAVSIKLDKALLSAVNADIMLQNLKLLEKVEVIN
jgi:hypothetical protein